MRGRSSVAIELSDEERGFLKAQLRKHKAERSLSDRCRIVLRCANDLTSKEVARELGHAEHRIEGLSDEYRAGRPRTISDAQVAEIIKQTLETTLKDATHWSIRSMATETGYSHTTIRRIWNAFGLQPHRSETFKLSTDPLFVDKVQDVVGLYMSPSNRAIVLCLDEKSQIQALDREQPVLPMAPGVAERRTHAYLHNDTTSLFAALDVATGAVVGKCYKRHRSKEFLDFLKELDRRVPEGPEVHSASGDGYPVGSHAVSRTGTTSDGTDAATASRSCSAGSRIGGASRHVTTDAPRYSYPPSHSLLL